MRVLIVGGGAVGVSAARRMQHKLARRGDELVLVNPENFMQYQSLLPEAAAGTIEPRHVVVPLRQALRRTRLIVGEVERIDHADRLASIRVLDGRVVALPYELLILAPGSRSRTLPIPGLAEHGIGFKTVAEAIYLRNHILSRLDRAAEATDRADRLSALTFVFVGAGYAGVEALAELEDLARVAARYVPTVSREDMRWVLVEAGPTILPEIGASLAAYTSRHLRGRDIEVCPRTELVSAEGGVISLSDGRAFRADTLVWTAGVRPEPLGIASELPVDDRGRIRVDEHLRVIDVRDVWAAGDAAAVPDPNTPTGYSPPSAQHAVRQGRLIARNVLASIAGRGQRPFRYRTLGAIATLGRFRGIARILGIRLRGFPAWFVARSYHLSQIPTLNRKVRIVFDWTVGLAFPRDLSQLGSLQDPRAAFERAAEGREQAPKADERDG